MAAPRSLAVLILASLLAIAAACNDDQADTASSTAPSARPSTELSAPSTTPSTAPSTARSNTPTTRPTTTPSTSPSLGPQTIRLVDHNFEMPDVITGPLVDLDIVNDGTVAHELAIARVTPGTTTQQVVDAIATREGQPDFMLDDPGGLSLIGPGEEVRYQRHLEPGSYVIFCPYPTPDGTSHMDHGMHHLLTVSDTRDGLLPEPDVTITLRDDAIDAPDITAGTHRVAFTNDGTRPHGAEIAGVPSDADIGRATAEFEQWMEGGQLAPAPLPFDLPGGQQSIPPGETVLLTLHFEAGYTYQIEDFSDDEPIRTLLQVP